MGLYESGVRSVVDDYLVAEAKKLRDYGDYWSASSAGYCNRRLIFERLGVPHVTDDPRKQRVFSVGHIFHQFIQELTVKAGISVAQEGELQDEELMVRGHFDDLIRIGDNLILYDYKSASSKSFSYAKKNDNPMSYYHRMQLGTYMYMLRSKRYIFDNPRERYEIPKDTIAEARICKISKDDLRMDEQQLMWSKSLEHDVVTYWKTLNRHWKTRKLPDCTCADHENGFLAREAFNPYFYMGEPCSIMWLEASKKEGLWQHPDEST